MTKRRSFSIRHPGWIEPSRSYRAEAKTQHRPAECTRVTSLADSPVLTVSGARVGVPDCGQRETAHIPTLVITADARAETRARVDEVGRDCFLLRPGHPHALVEKVRELVGLPRPQIETA